MLWHGVGGVVVLLLIVAMVVWRGLQRFRWRRDLGRRDAEGFVYIVGRASDLVISAGKNIYAAEVERAIESHPLVAEAAIVGMPDARRGEIVVAFVRLEGDGELTAGALQRYLDRYYRSRADHVRFLQARIYQMEKNREKTAEFIEQLKDETRYMFFLKR